MLRDKFAMAAMQEIMCNEYERRRDLRILSVATNNEMAKSAYLMADAMIKERENWDFSDDPDAIDVHIPAFGGPASGYQPKKHPPKKP